MRFFIGLGLGLALGVMGCSETAGTGGSGGTAGNGGMGGDGGSEIRDCDDYNDCTTDTCVTIGSAGTSGDGGTGGETGSGGGEPCTTAEDCEYRECIVASCADGVCDYAPAEDGIDCDVFFSPGVCVAGECYLNTCDTEEDVGLCDHTTVPDGTQCAGGTCEAGDCQVTESMIPCTEQGYRNVVSAGGGPYEFDCDGPTELWGSLLFARDLILDGGGNVRIEGPALGLDVSAELNGFVIAANGGIANYGGDLRILGSTVTNESDEVEGDDILLSRGATLTLKQCTVAGSEENEMELLSDDGDTVIANSTLSFGSKGSGLTNVSADGKLTVTNSTLRSRGSNPVIAVTGDAPPATVAATIVEGDCVGLIDSGGYNIESPGDTCGFDQGTDLVNITEGQLALEPLADNGGPTMTHALLPDSVAIDVVPADMCEVDTDQRGEPRDSICDVGAFEVQP